MERRCRVRHGTGRDAAGDEACERTRFVASLSAMIVESAPAKLNLALHVRARRDDGYHELETLFVFVRDGDSVRLTPAERDGFAIIGPFASGLSGEGDNLVTRARDAFRGTGQIRRWRSLPA